MKKTGEGGIQVIGASMYNGDLDELTSFLNSKRIVNAVVYIREPAKLEDVKLAMDEAATFKPALIIANKGDLPRSAKSFRILRDRYSQRFPIYPVSSLTGKGFEKLGEALFSTLGVIRVFTKEPSKPPSDKPIILRSGATVRDAIQRLRPSMLKSFRYAKVYGPSAKYDGEKVGLDHVLMDGDVIQVHTS